MTLTLIWSADDAARRAALERHPAFIHQQERLVGVVDLDERRRR